jgi:hypothetical protein
MSASTPLPSSPVAQAAPKAGAAALILPEILGDEIDDNDGPILSGAFHSPHSLSVSLSR